MIRSSFGALLGAKSVPFFSWSVLLSGSDPSRRPWKSRRELRTGSKAVEYHDMLRLNLDARIMLTDSGGLQEECCVLGTPCLTLRNNTERPVTLREHGGASVLVGNDIRRIREEYRAVLDSDRSPVRPELWDGGTAERVLGELVQAAHSVPCVADAISAC